MITDVSDITSFKWATVTGVSPLAIKLDGDTSALALIPDSLVDPLELSVSDRVRVELSLRKVVIHGISAGGGQSGRMEVTAAATAPSGWLLAQGQSLLRSSYPRLFLAIGTRYGAPDSTHFSIPDTRGRVVVGGLLADTNFGTLGQTGGSKTHTLTEAEMPSHRHQTYGAQTGQNLPLTNTGNVWTKFLGNTQHTTGTADNSMTASGGGSAHNNLQPYVTLNYIIKI